MAIEFDEAGQIIGETLKEGAFYEFSTFDDKILTRIGELLKELEGDSGVVDVVDDIEKTYASLADTLKELR